MNKRVHIIILPIVLMAILLSAVIAIAGMVYLEGISKKLSDNAYSYSLKSELVVTLWNTQNERTNLLQSMLLEEDPFHRDELYLNHMGLASKFINARKQLLEMDLSDVESDMVETFSLIVKQAQPYQDQLTELALLGQREKTYELMQTAEYINLRSGFTDQCMTMMSYYKNNTQQAFAEVNNVVLGNTRFILILTATVLLMSAVIGFLMIRKMIAAEDSLHDEVNSHVITQDALETHRQHLQDEVTKEVEKHKRATNELLQSQSLAVATGQILEDSLNEIYIFDALNLNFIQVNKAARKNLGYTIDELKSLTPIDLKPDMTKEKFQELVTPLLNHEKEIIDFKTIHSRKDGSSYPVEVHLQQSKMGSTIVIVAMVLDITKRKRAEVNLLRKNKEFELAKTEIQYQKRALDEHAIVSVIAKDETLISVNGKFTEISKFTENELVGGHFCIGMSDDQPEEFFIELSGTIQRGEPWCGDICNMTKDGHPYWTKTTITPFIDTKGNIYKFVAISTDFTAQKMAEGDLRGKTLEVEQAHKELEASHNQSLQSEKLASVGQLAAGIAHEINTPIQFVGDNTRFLDEAFGDLFSLIDVYDEQTKSVLEGKTDIELAEKANAKREEVDVEYLAEEVPTAISQSLEGIDRVTKIVRSMKDFSHPGSDSKEVIDLNQAIESTITVSKNEWKYTAELETDLDESLIDVPCYPGEFNQVVLNIIVNAAHAIEDTRSEDNDAMGKITLSTKRLDNFAEIRIGDSGTGMPEEVRKRIFEPFFTTKGVGKGSGQGLAIAYTVIVDKHKGTLEVESEQGKGTTFIIRLPLDDVEDSSDEIVDEEDINDVEIAV